MNISIFTLLKSPNVTAFIRTFCLVPHHQTMCQSPWTPLPENPQLCKSFIFSMLFLASEFSSIFPLPRRLFAPSFLHRSKTKQDFLGKSLSPPSTNSMTLLCFPVAHHVSWTFSCCIDMSSLLFRICTSLWTMTMEFMSRPEMYLHLS